MDLLRIVSSIEEFLYEVIAWLVFFPRTLWRALRHPLDLQTYSQLQQDKPPAERYVELLSAPLFLILCLGISHLFELSLHIRVPDEAGGMAAQLLTSDQALLATRSLLFAMVPVMFALGRLKLQGQPADRSTLRGPFFGACYPTGVFGLVVGILESLSQRNTTWAWACYLGQAVAAVWLIGVEASWLRSLGRSWMRALWASSLAFVKALAVVLAAVVLMVMA